VDREGRLANM